MITCTWLLSCQKVTLGANVWEAMIISMWLLSCQKATLGGKCLASYDYMHVVAPVSQRGTQNTPNLDFNMKGL